MKEDLSELKIDVSGGGNKALQDEMFAEMRKIQELPEMWREVMADDIKRYFNATTPMEQCMIKGAYFRTKWILNQMSKQGDKKAASKRAKPAIGRYAA